MTTNHRYLDKELSWLSFNQRVLQQAADKSVPLLERVRFIGIYANNIDEFYKVRVAKIKRQLLHHNGDHQPAQQLLDRIQHQSLQAQQHFDAIYNALLNEMAQRHIYLINDLQPLACEQQQWLQHYFHHSILPQLTLIPLTDTVDLIKRLHHHCSYLIVMITRAASIDYVLVEIPTNTLPRWLQLPSTNHQYSLMLVENIIRAYIDDVIDTVTDAQTTYEQLSVYSIKITRDANYELKPNNHDVLHQLSHHLQQRLTAKPLRLVYQHTMPAPLLQLLTNRLRLSDFDTLIASEHCQHLDDLSAFPAIGNKYLHYAPLPTINSAAFNQASNVFAAITTQDILLYYPYHSFEHMLDFVHQAARDPAVRHISINIYRLAKQSRIIDSLIMAANNGKQVTVVVELQARFDEQANIDWAQQLTAAGITVLFGVTEVKIHAKLCLITRQEQQQLIDYAHIGTGNFNEQTARIYTDFSLFTRQRVITQEVRQLFDYLANPKAKVSFNHLIVSPMNARARLYALIDTEIYHAQHQRAAGITLKLNNLIDNGLIDKLYQASQHGVKIQLIIRGMCSLIADVPHRSENITITSIVDRFLEHSRVYIFTNNGSPKVFISSADWMQRNIDRRIEVGCPILSPALKQRIIAITKLQLADNVQARVIDPALSNRYVSRGKRPKIRSQTAIYNYLTRVEAQSQQLAHKEHQHHAK
ncbi:polyphosphate kinase 1 [Photobacterium andalusiense]|uniref:Polyphosphate kinase n=1 Tax=Photobacterium andalusiense TaxID=2204296 RepID=A0A1Y6MTC6_9GAMM|nr:polyphosphate kinase 1 [Photobacterium andalusiense]SMY38561.1 Polyphosphate kinase [Photobacterium andalusiense]